MTEPIRHKTRMTSLLKTYNKKGIVICSILFVIIIVWMLWENTALELKQYIVESEKIPESFAGFRIAQVSDLHNDTLGEAGGKLLKILSEAEPDIIVITGDMIDSRNTNVALALEFAEHAMKIAPCYFVMGNHEVRMPEVYTELEKGLLELGVEVLHNESVILEKEVDAIQVIGIDDPSMQTDYLFGDEKSVVENELQTLVNEEVFTILLSHRPELFETYVENHVDLAFTGHAHGGQFRLPFLGGIVAPNQGFFPDYDSGLYKKDNTSMLVSRGVGNSLMPIRFNNRPEVILVELKSVK